jgi:cytochrome b subunit of formate dehydrogenase
MNDLHIIARVIHAALAVSIVAAIFSGIVLVFQTGT